MGETERELVYSESIKAGKRIYYFDVKQSRNGDRYIAITESKKINEGTMDNPRFVFEKHKLFLYKEDFARFTEGLQDVIGYVKEQLGDFEQRPEWKPEEGQEPQAEGQEPEEGKKKGLFGLFK